MRFDGITKKVACKNGETPEKVKTEIEEAIASAWLNGKLKEVGGFTRMPTAEEFLAFAVKEITKPK